MADLTLYDKNLQASGSYSTQVNMAPEVINVPVVHQVVKAILAGKRQGTACTKSKSFVRGGGKKPFKQKGTGRARQGSSRSPLMVGGATLFGPKPRSYEQKLNKKMVLNAINSVLADKYQAGKLFVVDTIVSTGKTKEMSALLTSKGLISTLLIAEKKDSKAILATRNMQRATAMHVDVFNVYEALKYENLIIEKAALDKLLARFEK